MKPQLQPVLRHQDAGTWGAERNGPLLSSAPAVTQRCSPKCGKVPPASPMWVLWDYPHPSQPGCLWVPKHSPVLEPCTPWGRGAPVSPGSVPWS